MTDPGWAIPGVPRDDPATAADAPSSAAGSPAGAGSPGRAAKSARQPRPAASASASAGSSAGAFAGDTPSGSPPADSSGSSPAAAADGGSSPADAAGSTTGTAASGPPRGVEVADPAAALACLEAALEFLARADPACWPAGVQADCLRALAVAESRQAAAHARLLAAFAVPGGGLAGDGHRSPRVWLTWQTRATRRAAAAHVARMHALAAHPLVAAALAAGQVSLSWARQIIDWTSLLPADCQGGADADLLAAARAGADLAALAGIAEELRRRHAAPDGDTDDGFEDRSVRLAATFGGAGRLEGDLTPRCDATVRAVLDSLSAVRGPEDTRTLAQRLHDALEEGCLRLLAAGGLPERAGQPVRLELSITLDELARNGAGSAAGPGAACDALIQPVVTGHVDYDLLQRLADPGYLSDLAAAAATRQAAGRHGVILQQAIALLSGPAGHAAWLRRRLGGPAAGISLPLDIAGTLDTIPVHLRRAVRKRDQHCRFPGCDMPPAGCDVHHLTHRKDGGRHALANLGLFCRFHHHIAIHRWGWQVTLHPDGTTTAVSPDGTKILHSHPPPSKAA